MFLSEREAELYMQMKLIIRMDGQITKETMNINKMF